MKIALWNNLPSGGGKRAFTAMAAGLLKRGHQLESWCPPTADMAFDPLAEIMPEHVVEYVQFRRRRRLRLMPGRLGYGRQYTAMERHAEKCAQQIDAQGFDVCLVGNCLEYAVPPIGRYLRTPSVHYCQELSRAIHEGILNDVRKVRPGIRPRISSFVAAYWQAWQRNCERVDLAAFDSVLVNSFYSRESLLRAHGTESRVCYLGIDVSRFRLDHAERERVVVGLGALQPHKDPKTAIEAVASIPESDRPELIWIGNLSLQKYVDELRELALRLNVRLTLKVGISNEELIAELNRAAVMAYTSRLEPFGFAPLEGNACGLPVVAIAEGGVRETVRHEFNGLLVANRDPVALGAALSRLLSNPEEAKRLSENGREWVSRDWTWESCAQQLEQALSSVALSGEARE